MEQFDVKSFIENELKTVYDYFSFEYDKEKQRIVIETDIPLLISTMMEQRSNLQSPTPIVGKNDIETAVRNVFHNRYRGRTGVSVIRFGRGWEKTENFRTKDDITRRLIRKQQDLIDVLDRQISEQLSKILPKDKVIKLLLNNLHHTLPECFDLEDGTEVLVDLPLQVIDTPLEEIEIRVHIDDVRYLVITTDGDAVPYLKAIVYKHPSPLTWFKEQ